MREALRGGEGRHGAPTKDKFRSLAHVNHQLRAVGSLDGHINRLLAQQPGHVEVLEVGFGHGRVLLSSVGSSEITRWAFTGST